jgi:hypothetical protein
MPRAKLILYLISHEKDWRNSRMGQMAINKHKKVCSRLLFHTMPCWTWRATLQVYSIGK